MTFTEEDLRAVLADRSEPVPVKPDLAGTVEQRARSVRRHRRITATVLTACAATAITVGAHPGADRPVRPPVIAPPGPTPPSRSVPDVPPKVQVALRSVARITGTAPECGRRLEGSGFIFANERVMTTAHNVAGVRGPMQVRFLGSRTFSAQVVLFDPRRDIAVLRVPELKFRALRFDHSARIRESTYLAGYVPSSTLPPEMAGASNEIAQAIEPGRIRARQRAAGPDIYGAGNVEREIYAVDARPEPGVTGGPLLSSDGMVQGLIFASVSDSSGGGYALTADEIAAAADDGRTAAHPVSTRGCAG